MVGAVSRTTRSGSAVLLGGAPARGGGSRFISEIDITPSPRRPAAVRNLPYPPGSTAPPRAHPPILAHHPVLRSRCPAAGAGPKRGCDEGAAGVAVGAHRGLARVGAAPGRSRRWHGDRGRGGTDRARDFVRRARHIRIGRSRGSCRRRRSHCSRPRAAPIVDAPATPTAADRLATPGLDLRAPAVPLPVGEIRLNNPAHGRAPDMPMPQAEPTAVKDTLRRYYGNLPRSGRMPDRITVEEILPPAIIAALGVPGESQVVEIGHHPTTSPQGFEDILAQSDEHETTLGITVVTPDGQRVRDYIRLVPPAPQ
jgi:hypothetical protein